LIYDQRAEHLFGARTDRSRKLPRKICAVIEQKGIKRCTAGDEAAEQLGVMNQPRLVIKSSLSTKHFSPFFFHLGSLARWITT
jgi:hypothetical protein